MWPNTQMHQLHSYAQVGSWYLPHEDYYCNWKFKGLSFQINLRNRELQDKMIGLRLLLTLLSIISILLLKIKAFSALCQSAFHWLGFVCTGARVNVCISSVYLSGIFQLMHSSAPQCPLSELPLQWITTERFYLQLNKDKFLLRSKYIHSVILFPSKIHFAVK